MNRSNFTERQFGVLFGALMIALAVACGSAATPTLTPVGTHPAAAAVGDQDGVMAILATTVLDVGPQRLAFLLTTPKGLIKDADVSVTPVYLEDDAAGEPQQTEFHLWPYGSRGAYTTSVTFDRPGRWRLDIDVDGAETSGRTQVNLEIGEQSPVPALGEIGPLSRNKTLSTVASIEKLTTDYTPDPDLYQLTIEEAVASPLPSVVVFASPSFCTSPTCGPQVDTVSELKDAHRGEANFIHVEIYDNPDEIQGDLNRAEIAGPLDEWGLTSIPNWFNESWTFVLDPEGRIQSRFEGYATLEELEASLTAVLAGS
jgi:hypothetical protein